MHFALTGKKGKPLFVVDYEKALSCCNILKLHCEDLMYTHHR